jgi:DNA-binding response OmpR family regulator
VSATDGYSAIAQAYKERPDLIILDLGLPAGNGFVVLDRLQHDDKLSTIPVLVLTAREPHGNEDRALKAGAVAFFQKPVDNAELMQVINPRCHRTEAHLYRLERRELKSAKLA